VQLSRKYYTTVFVWRVATYDDTDNENFDYLARCTFPHCMTKSIAATKAHLLIKRFPIEHAGHIIVFRRDFGEHAAKYTEVME